MNKIILFLVLLFNFNALADDREQYQSALMSEYQSLLTKDTFNQDRINEIETIALENPYYELRQWIALSYLINVEVIDSHPKNPKKAFNFVHKSIKENFFNSIPLAIFTTRYPGLKTERKDLIKTLNEKVSLYNLSRIPLAEIYILNGDYDSAFEALGSLKNKYLGIYFDGVSQKVSGTQPNSAVPFLEEGDKILKINNEAVSISDISKILSRYRENSEQEITFERDNILITERFFVPKEDFNVNTGAHFLLWKSFSNQDFSEDDALSFINNERIQNHPSFLYYKNMVDAALCHHYLEDIKNTNDEKGLMLCKKVADGYINQFESLKNSNQSYSLESYEFSTEIGDRTQFLIYKTTLHHIINEAINMYYGAGLPKDKKSSIDLLNKYYRYYTDEFHVNDKWARKIFTEEHISGNLLDRNPKKAFEYSNNLFGEDERVTKLLAALVLDGDVDVSDSFLRKVIDDEIVHKFLVEKDLYDYVVYKSFLDMKPFDKGNINYCELASKNELIEENEPTQIVYSICVIDDEIENPEYDITTFINRLSQNGVSSGTYLIHLYNLGSSSYSSNYKKQLEVLKLAKNQSKKNKKQKPTETWLTEAPFLYYGFEEFIDEDIKTVTLQLRKEEEHQKALLKAKNQKERERLAQIRAANRKEAMRNTGNFLADFVEFTFKAALVVGAVAIAGDALEDSSPEVQQAIADSLSGSFSSSGQAYSNRYNSYQCMDARNELSSARKKLGLSNNVLGNMSCSNAGGSCMTPLPKQCYNRAASCKPGDYSCTARENNNYHYCQSQARAAAQNAKDRCEARKRDLINQCNMRVNNNNRNLANSEIRQAQTKVNQSCY